MLKAHFHCAATWLRAIALLLVLRASVLSSHDVRCQIQFGTADQDQARGVSVDSSGVYVVGFSGGIQADAFLHKLDFSCTLMWIRMISSSSWEEAWGVVATQAGIYVAGYTSGTLPNQTRQGGPDAFIRKYDPDGNEKWTRQFGTEALDYATCIAADDSGVYVSGKTEGTLQGETRAGGEDGFVCKYDHEGHLLWTRQFGTAGEDSAGGIALHGVYVYIAGSTTGQFPGETASGETDAFIRKYDVDGNYIWSRQFGTSASDSADGIAAYSDGIFVVGSTRDALPGQAHLGDQDAFIRKYDHERNELWTRQFGTAKADEARAVSFDPFGVFVVGSTGGVLPGHASLGPPDLMLVQFNLDGSESWTKQLGTDKLDHARAIALSPTSIYLAGETRGMLPDQTSSGFEDAFVIALGGLIPEPLALGSPKSVTLTEADPRRLFVLSSPEGEAVLVAVTDLDPDDANALYVRWSQPPSDTAFDHAADKRFEPSPRLVIPSTRNVPCYVLVQANVIHGGANEVTVLVERKKLALEAMSASEARQGSLIHVAILGGGFESDTKFELVPAGTNSGIPADPDQVVIISSSRAEAVFQLSGAEVGPYDLKATSPSLNQVERLEKAFWVSSTTDGPRLEAEIEGIRQGVRKFRYDHISRITLRYRNVGDTEMIAPLFKITAVSEEDPQVQAPDTELRLARETDFHAGELQVLGIHPNGVAGWLPPGAGWEIPIEFRSRACRVDCHVSFLLHVLAPTEGQFVRWDDPAHAAAVQMKGEDWQEAWPGLSRRFGASWVEYHEELARLATRLSHRGANSYSVLEIFRFAVREVLGRPSSALVGCVTLAGSGEPLPRKPIFALKSGAVWESAMTDDRGAFALDWLVPETRYDLAVPDHEILQTPRGGSSITLPLKGDRLALEVIVQPKENGMAIAPGCLPCDEIGLPALPILPPSLSFTKVYSLPVEIVSSWDPNKKECPEGEDRGGLERTIPPGSEVEYKIYFENRPCAGAPARRVVVTDLLDPEVFDIYNLRLRDVQIGNRADQRIALDLQGQELWSGYTRYLSLVRYSAEEDLEVHLSGSDKVPVEVHVEINWVKRGDRVMVEIRWEITAHGDDWLVGFLPANYTDDCTVGCAEVPENGEHPCKDGRGEAYVSFLVPLLEDLPEGKEIAQEASVEFDGIPVDPGQVNALRCSNTVSCMPPNLLINPLAPRNGAVISEDEVLIRWSADKAEWYDVFLWIEGESPGEPVASRLPEPSFLAKGLTPNKQYRWQVRAGNACDIDEGPEWVFKVKTSNCPPDVVLQYPPTGETGVSPSPMFRWDLSALPGEDPVLFEILLWKDTKNAEKVAVGFLARTFQPKSSLDPGTKYLWQVRAFNADGCVKESPEWSFIVAEKSFQRGDSDGNGQWDLTDAIYILNYLFLGGPTPACLKSADADDSAGVDISDAVYILNFLFLGGSPPPEPFDHCGTDPNQDQLGCREYPPCE